MILLCDFCDVWAIPLIVLFVFTMIGIGFFSYFKKNRKKKCKAGGEILKPEIQPAPAPPPLPKTRKFIKMLTAINNRTEYKHSFASENNYGLEIKMPGGKQIDIRQNLSDDGVSWHLLGRFFDHSISEIKWETITINDTTDPQEPNEDNNQS